MKDLCCTSVDGENFASALETGFLQCPPDQTPFQRGLKHIEARNTKLMGLSNEQTKYDGNRPYDETNSVNNS